MTALLRYDAACRAITEAKAVDEVKDIHNKAEAVRHYARQAKNRTLEVDAVEIRVRAERRLGEMLCELRSAGGIRQGRRARGAARTTLNDIGIPRKLSMRAQRLAAWAPDAFESRLSVWRVRALRDLGRVTSPGPKEMRGMMGSARNCPALAVSSRDVGSWTFGELRRMARIFAVLAEHCGGADDAQCVKDCVSDRLIRAILESNR